MLTITEEAEGRGSLGKVTAGRKLHKSGPQEQGRGGTLFQDLLRSLFIIVEVSARRGSLQLTTCIGTTPTSPTPSHPRLIFCHLHTVPTRSNNACIQLHFPHSNAPYLLNCYNALVSNNVTPGVSKVTERTHLITGIDSSRV